MKRMSRLVAIGVITLLVLSSACNLPAQPPLIPTTTSPTAVTGAPTSIDITAETPAPAIPITGLDVVSQQCQFCVNEEAHAVLIMSNQAFFNVAEPSSGVTCLSAKEMDGRRILLCHGAQQASFTLNVCVDNANCLEFPITLQPCPLVPGMGTGTPTVLPTFAPITPVILTPRNRLVPPTSVPPTSSTTIPLPTDTSVSTPQPTSTTEPPAAATSTPEPATVEPPAPTASSSQGGGGGEAGGNLVICHVSQGNPDERTTLTISRSAWENEHSKHGDSLGAC